MILHADIIHLKRADGNGAELDKSLSHSTLALKHQTECHQCAFAGIDAVLHVEPDSSKCKERAMLVIFNQNPNVSVNTTLRVPLYYSGLDTNTTISVQGGPSTTMTLARDWSVLLPVVMKPNSFSWVVFY